MASARKTEFFVARESFHADIDGVPTVVSKGEIARVGASVLDTHAGYFEPIDRHVRYDVEQATAAPGERRGIGASQPGS